jgi:hypothetical protein
MVARQPRSTSCRVSVSADLQIAFRSLRVVPAPFRSYVLCTYVELASLVPREEYIHRAPYRAIESLRLHAINHA